MNKSLIIAFISLSLFSCGSYTLTNNKGYEVKSILAVTEVGDTVAVPYRQFVKYRDTEFVRYRYNNSWHWNNWRYNDPAFLYQYNSWNYYGQWNYNWNNNFHQPRTRPVNRPKSKPRFIPTPRPRPRQPRIITNETNTPNTRSPRQTQTRSNGGRSRNRQIVPTQPIRPRVTPPSQPRQVRRGSGQSSVQQTNSRGSSSQQRSRSTGRREN